jgi:hypothetical protein
LRFLEDVWLVLAAAEWEEEEMNPFLLFDAGILKGSSGGSDSR